MTFDDLKIPGPLQNALADLGFTTPTPIQEQVFSIIKAGRDVVGIAQTGTGKTFAYLLPILSQLRYSEQYEPRIVIIVPTRELVVQMTEEVEKLTKYMNLTVLGVYGGTNINTQKTAILAGVDVLVGTAGRIMDLALSRILNLKQVKHFVLDEVDEMFTLGFRVQLTTIFDLLPKKRQNLMFSATMTEEVDDLIQLFFNGPQYIEPVRAGTPLERIRQQAYEVPNFFTKVNLLLYLLKSDETMTKVLIFGPSKKMADLVYDRLEQEFPDQFDLIHGNKSQNLRRNAVVQFEKGAIRGLIATDLLARGLDVSDVSHVINLNTPDEPETYIHRIGRTGRADRDGEAILFFTPTERPGVDAIEALMQQSIPVNPLPEDLTYSEQLTEEERLKAGGAVDYLPAITVRKGAFHEKSDKKKKVNKGNKAKYMRDKKYSKPIKKKKKR